jgi:hypothetical protein
MDYDPPSMFKVHITPIPAMLWDRRSRDIEDTAQLTVQICTFQIYGTDPSLLNQRL